MLLKHNHNVFTCNFLIKIIAGLHEHILEIPVNTHSILFHNQFSWCEISGPLWLPEESYLVLSDKILYVV